MVAFCICDVSLQIRNKLYYLVPSGFWIHWPCWLCPILALFLLHTQTMYGFVFLWLNEGSTYREHTVCDLNIKYTSLIQFLLIWTQQRLLVHFSYNTTWNAAQSPQASTVWPQSFSFSFIIKCIDFSLTTQIIHTPCLLVSACMCSYGFVKCVYVETVHVRAW